ncbi:MAG TPA: hypothetical protein VHP33_29465 [Polyangiaceae bacterium]|nr:hypothetical protein [Polyangiaceae bacterium]
MRQIHIGAWLLMTCWTVAACSGDKFTASESGATNETPAEDHGNGSSSGSQAGSSSAAGSTHLSTSGKSASAGGSSGVSGAAGSRATGGASNSGGTGSYSGGANVAGGQPGEECPSGSITFRMLPDPNLPAEYLCDAGCGTGWLTITDAEGSTAFSIFSACGTASCETCEMLPCTQAACLPTPLTSEGSQLEWNGTYLAKDTCGANLACQRPACVKPGKYKAKACAAISAGAAGNSLACQPQQEMLCAQAEFEFPATTTVKLQLKK